MKLDTFFISSTFICNARLKLIRNEANTKQHPKAELYYLKIILVLHARYHPKIMVQILKTKE